MYMKKTLDYKSLDDFTFESCNLFYHY